MDVIRQLQMLDMEKDPDRPAEITVYINTPGGSVIDGLALYEVMRMSDSPIRTVCVGIAASMGSILFLAGDKREMLKGSEVMIHDPHYSGGSYTGQKPAEIKHMLDSLLKEKERLCAIIAERTGKDVEQIKKITEEDRYFDADEAIEFGLATGYVTKF